MDRDTRNRLETRANVFKALGHPTRLLIVQELSTGGRAVSELTGMAGACMGTVSRHLSVLRNAGIIQGDKRGSQVFYALRVPCVMEFLDCVERVLAGSGTHRAAPRRTARRIHR